MLACKRLLAYAKGVSVCDTNRPVTHDGRRDRAGGAARAGRRRGGGQGAGGAGFVHFELP